MYPLLKGNEMTIDFKALGKKAATEGANMTVAKSGGGGDYKPPAAGPTRLRFVGYVEVGEQEYEFEGNKSWKPTAVLVFELSGKQHPPTVSDDGTKIPHRLSIELPISLNEKANFFKLFQRRNYKGEAQHIVQLLGEAYRGEVIHKKYPKKGEDRNDQSKWTGL